MTDANHYLGNPLLKKANVPVEWTQEQILEYKKCMEDPMYFCQNYIKIVSLDEGLIPFNMFPFQKEMIGTIHNNRFTICKLPRQSGKTTTIVSYILHYVLFNPNMNVAILANSLQLQEIFLEDFNLHMKTYRSGYNKALCLGTKVHLTLENGSRIVASSTSSSAVRGGSYNMIFLDEFAFVPHNVAEDFFSSVYPTISSGKSTKVIIVSTPNGMNLFYKLWSDAETEETLTFLLRFTGQEVPGRDEKWKEETIANTSQEQFNREFECEFLGSVNTLIHPTKIKSMHFNEPIQEVLVWMCMRTPKKVIHMHL